MSASGHGAVQSLTRAVSESLALDPTHTSTLALHAALVGTDTTARAGGEEEMEVEEEDQAIRKGIQVLLQHCRRCPTNIPARVSHKPPTQQSAAAPLHTLPHPSGPFLARLDSHPGPPSDRACRSGHDGRRCACAGWCVTRGCCRH